MNFDWPVVNLCKSTDEHDDNEDEDEFDHNKNYGLLIVPEIQCGPSKEKQ